MYPPTLSTDFEYYKCCSYLLLTQYMQNKENKYYFIFTSTIIAFKTVTSSKNKKSADLCTKCCRILTCKNSAMTVSRFNFVHCC